MSDKWTPNTPKTGQKAMQPHVMRVVKEREELDVKFQKLTGFMELNPLFHNLPYDERVRLLRQAEIMKSYLDVLGERIAAFPPE